jgi:hypothetical protein
LRHIWTYQTIKIFESTKVEYLDAFEPGHLEERNILIMDMNESYAAIIFKKHAPFNMKSWKCYRCDLTFKQELYANIHQDITNHPFNKIGD